MGLRDATTWSAGVDVPPRRNLMAKVDCFGSYVSVSMRPSEHGGDCSVQEISGLSVAIT